MALSPARLRHAARAGKLHAPAAGLTDADVAAGLAGLAAVPGAEAALRVINLRGNALGDEAARLLVAALPRLPKLAVLNVAGNALSAAGLAALAEAALRSPALTALNAEGNAGELAPAVAQRLAAHLAANRQASLAGTPPHTPSPPPVPVNLSPQPSALPAILPEPHVAIVGGGIGGLALALALAQRGLRCTVYEKDERFDSRHQGYGLTLQQGSRSIRELGLAAEVGEACVRSSRHFIFDPQGHVVAFWGPAWEQQAGAGSACASKRKRGSEAPAVAAGAAMEPPTSLGCAASGEGYVGKANLHLPRQVLRAILAAHVPDEAVTWGAGLEAVEEIGAPDGPAAVRLHFMGGGPPVVASTVVGCDGVRSVLRQRLLGDPLQFLGALVVLGITPCEEYPLTHQRVFQTSDGTTRIFVMPFSATHCMWQLSFPAEEAEALSLSARRETLREEALRRCGDWHEPLPAILKSTPLELISGYPVYDREPLPSWDPLRAPSALWTLAGDAAHCMSPFKGQGANQALLDALQIAKGLARRRAGKPKTSYTTSPPPLTADFIVRAFRDYEQEMLQRTTAQVLNSRKAVSLLHRPEFVDPEYQAGRKGLLRNRSWMLERVQHLRAVGVGAADVAGGRLDTEAFGLARTQCPVPPD